MALSSSRWRKASESEFPWERDALQYLADSLPDREPTRFWSNFEFVSADGYLNEVDGLVLTGKGIFLVEIKSRPGRRLDGDAYTWTWSDGARSIETDNPLVLADRKAKRLASLLAPLERRDNIRLPFIETLIFCSAAGLDINLPANLAIRVFGRDRYHQDGTLATPGILQALTASNVGPRASERPIDSAVANSLARMLDRAGACRARSARRINGYKLGERLSDGPLYQDFVATHPALSITRRVRLYPYPHGAAQELRTTIRRAAEREFRALENITHPSLLKPTEFVDSEFGPSLLYDFDPGALRLDYFMRRRHDSLSLETRVHLIREVAEALGFAHEHRRLHRGLSPQCVLVRDPESDRPTVQITNWQLAAYTGEATTGIPTVLGPTQHVSQLVEDAQIVYLAPEANRPGELSEASDVFSLGAIAYFVLTGQPPAATSLDLAEKLRRGGLLLSDALDAPDSVLSDTVREATAGAIGNRSEGVDDVLAGLDLWEEQATRPDTPRINAADAQRGDTLVGAFAVEKRLGKGATAVALQVDKGGERLVLKVALGPEYSERVREEGEVLAKLRHPNIVGIREIREFDQQTALVLEFGGDRTLARILRDEGRLSLDFLERFGTDLLEALDYLEQKGIWHRDIKPENIGVAPLGRGDKLHLVLFDFSLSRTPVEQFRAGTPGYLDPFITLRRPPQYDLHAERFAAAVTLYEMATGRLPVWGDGSDPGQLDCEVTVDTDLMDAPVREKLSAFFRRALARETSKRFDNAEEMRGAWSGVFQGHETRVVVIPRRDDDFAVDQAKVAAATLETSIDQLGLSVRAVNALERLGCSTLRDMLLTPVAQVFAMRGVGNKTRRELGHAFERYQERFAGQDLSASSTAPVDEATASLDSIFGRLMSGKDKEAGNAGDIVRHVLGLEGDVMSLPSQTEVAQRLGVSRAYVSQVLQKPRNRWGKDRLVTAVRREINELLGSSGCVLALPEAVTALIERRGSVEQGESRTRRAVAVLRAGIEAESALREPRFSLQRREGRVLLSSDLGTAAYAFALGDEADRLATADMLLPAGRVVGTLRGLSADRHPDFDDARLVKLAAFASRGAAASPRLELYPRGMAALRAAKLASNLAPAIAVGGQSEVLSVEELRRRVAGRFPEAEPLPDRPALDELLEKAEWNTQWDASAFGGRGGYRSKAQRLATTSSATIAWQPTFVVPRLPDDEEAAAARRFDERLRAAAEQGGFLVLTVPPKYLGRAESQLVRQYGVRQWSVETELLRSMRDTAAAGRVAWDVVLRADAASKDSQPWRNLQAIVRRAMTAVTEKLPQTSPAVLLTSAGLLARYEQMSWLSDISQKAGHPTGMHGAWLLVPWEDPGRPPSIDGQAIPALPAQRAHIPDGWLANRHRAGTGGPVS